MTDPDPPDSLVQWVTTLSSYSDAKDVAWFHARDRWNVTCPHAVWLGKVGISMPQHIALSKLSWESRELNFDAFAVFPYNGSIIRHLASLHAVRLVPVPAFHRYYQGTTTPVARPSSLRFLRSVVPRLRLVVRSVRPETQGRRPGYFLYRHTHYADYPVETAGAPKFLGNPNCPGAMFFDPGETTRP
jgi:hypothetical protein